MEQSGGGSAVEEMKNRSWWTFGKCAACCAPSDFPVGWMYVELTMTCFKSGEYVR